VCRRRCVVGSWPEDHLYADGSGFGELHGVVDVRQWVAGGDLRGDGAVGEEGDYFGEVGGEVLAELSVRIWLLVPSSWAAVP